MGKTHDLGVADPWGCSRLSWAWCAKKWGLLQTLWCIENMQSSTRCIYGSSSCSSTAGFLERWQETVESGEAIWFDTCSILQHIFNYIYMCICVNMCYIYIVRVWNVDPKSCVIRTNTLWCGLRKTLKEQCEVRSLLVDGEALTLQHRLVSHFLDTATEYELIGLPDNLYTVDEIQAQFN
jgi:hypothetical protein